MMTLYTAVGSLRFQTGADGKSHPFVRNNHEEYGLSDHELLVWSCLAFQIVTIHELEKTYTARQKSSDSMKELPLSHYLNRLILRGLVVQGSGISGVDALYRLLGRLFITPIEDRFSVRLFSCIRLLLDKKITGAEMAKYLKKPDCTAIEKVILELAQTVPITTAELVTCIDRRKTVRNAEDIMAVLYENPDATSETLVDDVQLNHTQYPVLQAIGDLYLNKQILFQKI